MALVIECVDTNFILPKLSFEPTFDSGVSYVNKTNREEILSSALSMSATYLLSEEYARSFMTPENLVVNNVYKTEDSGHALKDNPDWKVYFNAIIDFTRFFRTSAIVLVNKKTGEYIYNHNGFDDSNLNIDYWKPDICFLFESSQGHAFITFVGGSNYSGHGYGLSQSKIAVDDEPEMWKLLFPKGEIEPGYPDDNTGAGGGFGDHDNTSDPIDIPSSPSISAASTGFISLFNPSLAQLKELASYMWSDLFNIDGWK